MMQRQRIGTGTSTSGRADSSLASAFAVVVVAGIAACATRDLREVRRDVVVPVVAPTNRPAATAAPGPASYVAPATAPPPPGIETSLRADPRWNELEFAVVARPPFVSARGLVPSAGTDWSEKARSVATRDTAIAHAVHTWWTECFGPLPPPDTPGDETLLRVILPDAARFALAYEREERTLVESGTGAFCAADGTAYIGWPPRLRVESIPCGESEMQTAIDCSAAAAAAAQLLVVARARTPQSDTAVRRRAFWFERGFLAWMSGIETARGDAATADPGAVSMNRLLLDSIRNIRGSGQARTDDGFREAARIWTIPRILDLRSDQDAVRVGGRSVGAPVHRWVTWGFVHFLWNYDGGRYRETVRAALAADLRGDDATAAFRDAVAKIDPATARGDWAAVQREFWWYWDKLLARGVGWKHKQNGAGDWWRMPTTPPVGRWEPPPPDEEEEEDEGAADDR